MFPWATAEQQEKVAGRTEKPPGPALGLLPRSHQLNSMEHSGPTLEAAPVVQIGANKDLADSSAETENRNTGQDILKEELMEFLSQCHLLIYLVIELMKAHCVHSGPQL